MATLDPQDELNPYSPPAAGLDRDDVGPTKTQGIDLVRREPVLDDLDKAKGHDPGHRR